MQEKIVETENLVKEYRVRRGFTAKEDVVHALNGVDLSILKGDTMGIVGESGCGKTTLANLMVRLLIPTRGSVYYRNKNIYDLKGGDLLNFRHNVQMVFQDPQSTLDPRMKIRQQLMEPLIVHKSNGNRKKRVEDILEHVGLKEVHGESYPYELSGGQKQRVAIARALILRPELIVFDEPTSHLDVSIQASILHLLMDLKNRFDLTYVYISHDLSVVRNISDRVCVIYLGKVIELAQCDELFSNPLHPYTKALLSAIPKGVEGGEKIYMRKLIRGEVPSPMTLPTGCFFSSRCECVEARCHRSYPPLEKRSLDHEVACYVF